MAVKVDVRGDIAADENGRHCRQPVRQVDAKVVRKSPPVKLTEGCCPGLLTVATPVWELSTQGKLVN